MLETPADSGQDRVRPAQFPQTVRTIGATISYLEFMVIPIFVGNMTFALVSCARPRGGMA